MGQSGKSTESAGQPAVEAESFLQATLDALATHIAVLNETGAIVAVNRAWRDFAARNEGTTISCGVGANYLQACDSAAAGGAEAAGEVAQAIRDIIAGRRHDFSLEYDCHSPSEKRWFIATVTRFAGEGPPRVVVSHENITKRRRAEDELGHVRRQYELIFNSISEGIHRFDKEGRIVFENPAAIKMLGWEGDDIIGRPSHETIHNRKADGSSYPKTECPIYNTLHDGIDRHIDSEVFWRRDGTCFPVEYSSTVIRDEEGENDGVVVSFRDITERRRAAEQLHQGEMRLRALVESIDEIVFEFDGEGTYLNIWTNHENLLVRPRDELIGRKVTTVPGEEPGGRFIEIFRRVIEKGQAESLEYSIDARAGQLWFLARVSPIFGADGVCNSVCMLARNITERKHAEEMQVRLTAELQHEHRRLDDMLANVPGVVWEAYGQPGDAMPQLGYASPWVVTMLGYSVEEWLTTPNFWLTCMHPDDRENARNNADRIFASGQVGVDRYRWIAKDGRTLWVESHSTAIHDAKGRPVGMRGVTMDITERKQAEEQRDRFFDLSLDFLCIGDINGYFRRVNPSFVEALGFTESELLSKPLLDFVHPDDQEATRRILAQLAQGRSVDGFQNRYRTIDGSWRWLEWRAVPVAEEQLLYGAARDITERKESEAVLDGRRDELEFRVRERTAELAEANTGLERAREEAERAREAAEVANRAKSEFLSRMSHELRTPMNAILGFGQVLEMRELGQREKQGVAHILKAGRHLLELINEVLDISRIEAGKMSLSLETIDIANIMAGALDLVRPLAAERSIELVNEMAARRGWHVRADRQRLNQVLLNLLANAIKYNREGGRVTITAAEKAEGKALCLSISDTGPGLSADELTRLFVPFERLGAEHRGIEGTGIGLVLSRQLLEVMGGSLNAESTPGAGSTFRIDFPLTRGSAEIQGSPNAELPAAVSARAGSTVLYIEDNLSNLTLVEHVLERDTTITLLSAMQGSIGLDLAHQHHPDLILLDLHLPDISGEEVLQRLRAETDTRAIPVIVLSADATSAQINRLMQAGVAGYLTKPLDIIQFVEVVTKLLNERGER